MFEKQRISILIFVISQNLLSLGFAQTDWTKYLDNPVMVKDTTIPGIWEWAGIGQPSCLVENDTIKMWYAAGGVSGVGDTIVRGRISYAYSLNGIDWIKRNPPIPVLDVGLPGTWDSRWLDTPAIVRDDTEYKLYYYGDSQAVAFSAIGLATSSNGIDWIKYGNNPVLEKSDSILDWDGLWIESAAVLYDAQTDTYQIWYSGVAWDTFMPYNQHIEIGYAASGDGVNWVKDTINNPVFETGNPGSWDDAWVAVPAVRKVGGIYQMWYCGVSMADWQADGTLDTARIGYATSLNGIEWTRYPGNPVLSNFDLPVDTGGPWAPDAVFDGVEYKMLYEANGPTGHWICLTTAPLSGIAEVDKQANTMLQVLPNPFSDIAYVKFQILPAHSREFSAERESSFRDSQGGINSNTQAKLGVYNIAGQLVKSFLLSTDYNLLSTSVVWDATDDSGAKLPTGVYFIKLEAGNHSVTKKCLYLK